jgi:alcohol dehydrogenase, propanol-preferring
MGLNVIAVDIDDANLDLARNLGASLAVPARTIPSPSSRRRSGARRVCL